MQQLEGVPLAYDGFLDLVEDAVRQPADVVEGQSHESHPRKVVDEGAQFGLRDAFREPVFGRRAVGAEQLPPAPERVGAGRAACPLEPRP